jgi:predicted acylesterase/phospholipase RssA
MIQIEYNSISKGNLSLILISNFKMDQDAAETLLNEPPQPSKIPTTYFPREDTHGLIFRILRWPLFFLIMGLLLFDLWLYFLLRQFVRVYEAIFGRFESHRIKGLRNELSECTSYEQWKAKATLLDKLLENDKWKSEPASSLYNYKLLAQLTKAMQEKRKELLLTKSHSNLRNLKKILLEGSLRHNAGGTENIGLYSHSFYGTKNIIQSFINETEASLKAIEEFGEDIVGREALYAFFKKALGSYGRSVLCLSGGGACGYFHLGVLRALGQADLIPQVICGTSAGAVVCGFLCTHTDDELEELLFCKEPNEAFYETMATLFELTKESRFTWVKRFVSQGHMMDVREAEERLKVVCSGDITFLEAYQKTGRILNITITTDDEASPPQLLNYKITPDVVIYSAVLASASLPGLLPSIQLLRRKSNVNLSTILDAGSSFPQFSSEPFEMLGTKWRDGSFVIDIPLDHLKPLFNIKFSLVSQVNPGVALFFYDSRGSPGQPHLHRRGHGYRAGFLSSLAELALKLDMKRYLELLGSLSLMPRFLKQDWSLVLLQRRDGTVTIVPSTNVWDVGKVIHRIDAKSMQEFIQTGERATWPMLKMFSNRIRIEKLLSTNLMRFKRE